MLVGRTESVCPVCLRKLSAEKRTGANGYIYMDKQCPEHGKFSTLIWENNLISYMRWNLGSSTVEPPVNGRDAKNGCPNDCGLCKEHLRKGCCMLLEQLAPAHICASPGSTGRGTVRCAHGELPVPAPATAYLLQGIPTQPGPAAVTGELCTPTGAALLAQFAASFGPRPAWEDAVCGCGFGTKRFPLPNCVRAWLGSTPR